MERVSGVHSMTARGRPPFLRGGRKRGAADAVQSSQIIGMTMYTTLLFVTVVAGMTYAYFSLQAQVNSPCPAC